MRINASDSACVLVSKVEYNETKNEWFCDHTVTNAVSWQCDHKITSFVALYWSHDFKNTSTITCVLSTVSSWCITCKEHCERTKTVSHGVTFTWINNELWSPLFFVIHWFVFRCVVIMLTFVSLYVTVLCHGAGRDQNVRGFVSSSLCPIKVLCDNAPRRHWWASPF